MNYRSTRSLASTLLLAGIVALTLLGSQAVAASPASGGEKGIKGKKITPAAAAFDSRVLKTSKPRQGRDTLQCPEAPPYAGLVFDQSTDAPKAPSGSKRALSPRVRTAAPRLRPVFQVRIDQRTGHSRFLAALTCRRI